MKKAVQMIENAWLDFMYRPGNAGYTKAKDNWKMLHDTYISEYPI